MTIMMGAAAGTNFYTPINDVITLSGTTGSPNIFTDFALSPLNAQAHWEFRTDGSLWKMALRGSDIQFQSGVQWCASTPLGEYWARWTFNANDVHNVGSASGTWRKIAGSGAGVQYFGWLETTDGFATTEGSVKVEIASDSGGSTIVATGYYGGKADVEF